MNIYCGLVIGAEKTSITRGFQKTYIPDLNSNCDQLDEEYKLSDDADIVNNLTEQLYKMRKKKNYLNLLPVMILHTLVEKYGIY